jgi:hypothetical protein
MFLDTFKTLMCSTFNRKNSELPTVRYELLKTQKNKTEQSGGVDVQHICIKNRMFETKQRSYDCGIGLTMITEYGLEPSQNAKHSVVTAFVNSTTLSMISFDLGLVYPL